MIVPRYGMGDDTTAPTLPDLSGVMDFASQSFAIGSVSLPLWGWAIGAIVAMSLFSSITAPGREYEEKARKLRQEYSVRGRLRKRASKVKKGFGVAFS